MIREDLPVVDDSSICAAEGGASTGDRTGKRRTMPRAERELELDELASHLKGVEAIEFAYAHGSFVKQDRFGDIDVAVFFSEGCSADKRFVEGPRPARVDRTPYIPRP